MRLPESKPTPQAIIWDILHENTHPGKASHSHTTDLIVRALNRAGYVISGPYTREELLKARQRRRHPEETT